FPKLKAHVFSSLPSKPASMLCLPRMWLTMEKIWKASNGSYWPPPEPKPAAAPPIVTTGNAGRREAASSDDGKPRVVNGTPVANGRDVMLRVQFARLSHTVRS